MKNLLVIALFVAVANCFYIDNKKSSKDKIVGGEYVNIETVPYLAQLVDEKYVCGASIISEHWLVCAAHCFEKPSNHPVIITGSSIRNVGEKHILKRIIIHRSFDNVTFNNDIALIELKNHISFNKSQKPIRISKIPTKAGQTVKISGFGNEAADKISLPYLKAATAILIDRAACAAGHDYDFNITENMFCTSASLTVDACQGDSGGPVVHEGLLVGIISWGIGCAEGYPGVYTQIANYYDWIREKTGLTVL